MKNKCQFTRKIKKDEKATLEDSKTNTIKKPLINVSKGDRVDEGLAEAKDLFNVQSTNDIEI